MITDKEKKINSNPDIQSKPYGVAMVISTIIGGLGGFSIVVSGILWLYVAEKSSSIVTEQYSRWAPNLLTFGIVLLGIGITLGTICHFVLRKE